MNRYEFEAACLCPNGKLRDLYQCSLASARTLPVESIVSFVKKLAKRKLYQEQLADALRNEFMACVVVIGWHYGVKLTCSRE